MAEDKIDSTPFTSEDRQLVLDLIRDARLMGILEIEYKSLRIRLSPAAASSAQRETYLTQNGQVAGWSTTIPKVGR